MEQVAATPRKKPKQRRSQETVRAILEATAHILAEEGTEKASTNRIAKRAGVSIGSLYQYFPNKEALLLAVCEQHRMEMMELLRASSLELAEAPLEVAVKTYVRAILDAHAVNPKLHQAISHMHLDIGWDLLNQMQIEATALVQGYLENHKEEIAPTNLQMAAFTLVMAVEGVIHAALMAFQDELDFDELEHEIYHLILGYLRKRPL